MGEAMGRMATEACKLLKEESFSGHPVRQTAGAALPRGGAERNLDSPPQTLAKHQWTIKKLKRAGLLPLTKVEFEFDGRVVHIAPNRARGMIAALVLSPTGRGRGDVATSTDAVMALTRDD